MKKLLIGLTCLTLLTGCTKVFVVGSLRPQLPVPAKLTVTLPVEGLKKKQLTPKEIEQLLDVLYRTTVRAEPMEATMNKYNKNSIRINEEIKEGLGLTD